MKNPGIVLFVFALATAVGIVGRPVSGPATLVRPSTYGTEANKNGAIEGTTGYEQRRKIRSTLFVPDPLPALESESYGQFEAAPGVIAERVSYATGYGLRVPAIVYRPKNVPSSKMPAIVVVNGHGGDKYTWDAYYAGVQYAQAGRAP